MQDWHLEEIWEVTVKELKGSEYKRFEEIKHIREDGTEGVLLLEVI